MPCRTCGAEQERSSCPEGFDGGAVEFFGHDLQCVSSKFTGGDPKMLVITGSATEIEVPSSAAMRVSTQRVNTTSIPFRPRANFSSGSVWVASLSADACRLRESAWGGDSGFSAAELGGSEAILNILKRIVWRE